MYIEPSLCGPGPLENFVPDENNNKPRLLTAVFEEFFSVECETGLEEKKEEDDSKRDRNILLLSGPAGALTFILRVLQHKSNSVVFFPRKRKEHGVPGGDQIRFRRLHQGA